MIRKGWEKNLNSLNERLKIIENIYAIKKITVMIIGLGSVGNIPFKLFNFKK